jgi:ketosteroid isomerase-like protein
LDAILSVARVRRALQTAVTAIDRALRRTGPVMMQQRLTAALVTAAMLMFAFSSPLAAELDDTAAQAAIRAKLMQWTGDFNAGKVQDACDLFASDLRYDYRGLPERNYQEMCAGLRRALNDPAKHYSYGLAIKDIFVFGDMAAVRLVWTLTLTGAGAQPKVSHEHGIDVFRRQADGAWRIIRFVAYDDAD